MPPTFIYIACLFLWLYCAGIVWFVAGLLSIVPHTRELAKRLAFAMAGTFPFVIAYQILITPFVLALVVFAVVFWKLMEPAAASSQTKNPLAIAVSIGTALLAVGAMLMASVAGFWDGWRTGWVYASGRNLRDVLAETPVQVRVLRLLRASAKWAQRLFGRE